MSSYWDGAPSPGGSTEALDHIKTDPTAPAGFYVCEMLDFGAWASKTEPTWNIKFSMRIIEGAQKDKFLVRWSSMSTKAMRANVELFTNTLGELPAYDPDHGFAEYDSIRRRIVGAVVKVKAETWKQGDKGGLNIYINQLVDSGDGAPQIAPEEDATALSDEDKIPF